MKEKLDRIIQERKQQQNNNPLIFWEHINILKKYLFIICFFVILFSSIAFFYNAQILKFLTKPLNGIDLIFLSPIDPITFIMKIDLLAGVILSAPIILYLIRYNGMPHSYLVLLKVKTFLTEKNIKKDIYLFIHFNHFICDICLFVFNSN